MDRVSWVLLYHSKASKHETGNRQRSSEGKKLDYDGEPAEPCRNTFRWLICEDVARQWGCQVRPSRRSRAAGAGARKILCLLHRKPPSKMSTLCIYFSACDTMLMLLNTGVKVMVTQQYEKLWLGRQSYQVRERRLGLVTSLQVRHLLPDLHTHLSPHNAISQQCQPKIPVFTPQCNRQASP
jgi:hypothetical protein